MTMGLPLTRRQALHISASALALSAMGDARAQAPASVKYVGAAAVARPDQGFMFVGMSSGFCKDLGLTCDFFTTAGSGSVLQLIATNQAQLGHCGMQELISTKLKNPTLPVRAVFMQDIGAAYEIVVPNTSAIKSLADLKGKKIGVISLASGAIPFIRSMLRAAQVDPASVELLPVGAGAQALAAMRTNQVDALSLFRGSHAALETLGIEFRYFTVNYPSSVMIANETYLKSNADVLVRALQAIVLNQVYMRESPEKAVRSFWTVNGGPKDEAKELREGIHLVRRAAELWKKPDDGRKWGEMTEKDWLELAKFSEIELTPAQASTLYTNDLIAAVNSVDTRKALDAARG